MCVREFLLLVPGPFFVCYSYSWHSSQFLLLNLTKILSHIKRKNTERHNYPVLQSTTPHKNTDIFTISLCRFYCVGNDTEIKTMATYVTSIIMCADCNSFQGSCRYYILPCSPWTFHNKTVILHNRNTQAAPSSVNYFFLSQNTHVRVLIFAGLGGRGFICSSSKMNLLALCAPRLFNADPFSHPF